MLVFLHTLLLLHAAILSSVAASPISGLVAYNLSSSTTMLVVQHSSSIAPCDTSLAFLSVVEFTLPVTSTPTHHFVSQSSLPPQSTSPVPLVECMGSGHPLSPPVATAPPRLLFQETGSSAVQPSISTTALPIVILVDANNGSSEVSGKVTFSIVFAICLFIALNLALFCLWNNRCRQSRSPQARPHVELTVAGPWRPSYSRPSSSLTIVPRASDGGDGSSVKGSMSDAQSLEPVARPQRARTPSGPRVPLKEGAATL